MCLTSDLTECLTSNLYIQCVWPLSSQSVFDLWPHRECVWPLTPQRVFDRRHLHTVCWPLTSQSVFDLRPLHTVCLTSDLIECVWPLTSQSVFDLRPYRECLTSDLYIQCVWPPTFTYSVFDLWPHRSPFHTAHWSWKIARKLPECPLCECKHVPGLIPGLIPGWGPSNIAGFSPGKSAVWTKAGSMP